MDAEADAPPEDPAAHTTEPDGAGEPGAPQALRMRQSLETSRRGVFAVGDTRRGSIKRVATAVGDGAAVVAAIHQHLADRALR
jgi:thioredoxin reductase